MKNTKQLLIAAAVASMSLNAMADVSISGEAKINSKSGDHWMSTDLTITGKSGDTSVVAQIGVDNNNAVEQLYMTSKVAGIDVKAGKWNRKKSELYTRSYGLERRIQASTSFGGIKLTYQDFSGSGGTNVAVASLIGGVKVMHKVKDTSTETKVSSSVGGIDVAYHEKGFDAGFIDDSITVKTSIQGVELTYVDTSSDSGTSMDGFFGKHHSGVTEANGVGISTSIAGNKLTFKMMDMIVDGVDDNKDKLILTRKLSSGATFEATYVDSKSNENSLDLELAVKF
ncbi:MAG: hypothetical protein NZ811_03040 [Gammaproteobacteria bacterium]|nr:hypothetical protein [Gammaproteobacteria bacterium]